MKTPIIIGIATIEARKESLVDTLESLYDQCDEIVVYQNGFNSFDINNAPHEDRLCDLTICSSEVNDGVDLGDVGKFFDFFNQYVISAYQLICDDDLIYPPDYVQAIIEDIERHERKAVVGFHGKEYYGPVESYYRSFGEAISNGEAFNYRCLDYVDARMYKGKYDNPVTVIGTGCTGWHSSLFKDNPISMDDFKHPNMADIWFSKKCNDLSIPRYVIPHEAGWINHTIKIDLADTIASKSFNDDTIQTEVFNSVEWKL